MLFRIIFLIILVLIAIPLVNKGKQYWQEKAAKIRAVGEGVEKVVRYSIGDQKK